MNAFALLADSIIAARGDPTWMYSTLAQTAGALVGVIAAVLITRADSHIAILREKAEFIRALIRDALRSSQGNQSTVLGRVNVESFGPDGREWYAQLSSHYIETKAVIGTNLSQDCIDVVMVRIREKIEAFPHASANDSLKSNDMRVPMEGEFRHFEKLRERLKEHKAQLVPSSFLMVFLLLVFLSVVGVAWPLLELAFLTEESSSRMVALVVAFIGGVLGLVGCFLRLLREMRSYGEFTWKVEA